MTASPLVESKFPVGSSASRMAWIAAQRSRHGDALLLAARKLRRIVLNAMRHAHAFQRIVHALLALGRRHSAVGERQFDVLIHREVADQVEGLENEADFAIADARAFAELEILHRLAVQNIAAVAGRIEQARESPAASTCRSPTARRSKDTRPS